MKKFLIIAALIFVGCGSAMNDGSSNGSNGVGFDTGIVDYPDDGFVHQGSSIVGNVYDDPWMKQEFDDALACMGDNVAQPGYPFIVIQSNFSCPEGEGVWCGEYSYLDVNSEGFGIKMGKQHDRKSFREAALHDIAQTSLTDENITKCMEGVE